MNERAADTTTPASTGQALRRHPELWRITVLAFASGLPLALSGGTLQAWLADVRIDIRTIGIFSLVGLPYTLKFLWAPLFDRYALLGLGRRRGGLVVTQVMLVLALLIMSMQDPSAGVVVLGLLALGLAFASASQDIVFDAYRTEVLEPPLRGLGAGLTNTGYRLAMLTSGALALVLAGSVGWATTYRIMAVLMAVGILVTLFSPEPVAPATAPHRLVDALWEPLQAFFSRPAAGAFLALIILYKFGDAFAATLSTAFLVQGVGFSVAEVGVVNKGVGIAAALFGAVVGGALMMRWGLWRALLVFGLMQALTNLLFAALALVGKSHGMLVVAVVGEQLFGGMGSAAFVALLMALCDVRYTATQYALFSAVAALARVFIGPPAGYLVAAWGWPVFFTITFLASLPALALIAHLGKSIRLLDLPAQAGVSQ